MRYINLPSYKYLHSILRYNKKNGKLYWKVDKANCIKAGTEAGYRTNKKYIQVEIDGVAYYAHRIIWKMCKRIISNKLQIDHIDGDTFNNKLKNLRIVTQSINGTNQTIPCNNKSGVIGVSYNKHVCLWSAKITLNGKSEQTYHKIMEDAIVWRRNKEIAYGFHINHGRSKQHKMNRRA